MLRGQQQSGYSVDPDYINIVDNYITTKFIKYMKDLLDSRGYNIINNFWSVMMDGIDDPPELEFESKLPIFMISVPLIYSLGPQFLGFILANISSVN